MVTQLYRPCKMLTGSHFSVSENVIDFIYIIPPLLHFVSDDVTCNLTSWAPELSYGCPGASETTLKHMGKLITWDPKYLAITRCQDIKTIYINTMMISYDWYHNVNSLSDAYMRR